MSFAMKKITVLLLSLLLFSCKGYFDRGPNSSVQHNLVENPFAEAVWSRNNIMIFIDENSTPLIAAPNRIIVSGIQPKRIHAFDSTTGELAWEHDDTFPNTMGVHENVFYATYSNNIRAYDTFNGENIWSVTLPYSGLFTSINFLDDKIFLYSDNGSFFILDSTGQVLESTGPNYYPMPYIVGDITYAGNDDGIVAFDTQTGNVVWETSINGAFYTQPYFFEDRIYLRTGTSVIPGSVYAIGKNDGRILWMYDADAISNVYPLGENLYFLTQDGYLVVLDQNTGSEISKIEFSPRPFILPTAEWRLGGYYVTADSVNNMIVVSTGDSYQLFALRIEGQ